MDGVEDAALRTRIEWTDVVGYPGDNGITFTGRPNQTQRFYAPITTPCWRDDSGRAHLAMVGFLFTSDDHVPITQAQVFDGRDHSVDLPIEAISGPHVTLVENVNRFDLAAPPAINWGIAVAFSVSFNGEGSITFHAVGADFHV